MEQDLGAKGPDPARARANADVTAAIPSNGPPAKKAEAAVWDRPAEVASPAGNRDPEDRVETNNQHRKRRYIMPGFDRTGPMGAGSMTGGGRGFCGTDGLARLPAPRGFRVGGVRGFSRGMGRCRGLGRGLGYRRRFRSPSSGFFPGHKPEKELEMLKNEAENLKKELDAIGNRIMDLEKTPSA
jgi:hypothetical protein